VKKKNFSTLVTLVLVSVSTASLSILGGVLEEGVDFWNRLHWGSDLSRTTALITALTWTAYSWIGWMEQRTVVFAGFTLVGIGASTFYLVDAHLGFREASLIIPALLTLGYAFPLGLRQRKGLKIHLITTSWTWTVIALSPHLAERWWIHGLWMYALIFAMTIPFDLRDAHTDSFRFQTLPQAMGLTGAKWVAWGSVLFVELTLLIQWGMGHWSGISALSIWALCEALSLVIWRINPKSPPHLFHLIDALPFITAGLNAGIFLILTL